MWIIIVTVISCLALFVCGIGWYMDFHKPYTDIYIERVNKLIERL